MHGSEPADAASRAGTALSVFGTIHPPLLSYGSDAPQANLPQGSRVRLASLESTSDAPVTTASLPSSSFDDRFAPDRSSFEERFGVPAAGSLGVRTVAVAPTTPAPVAAAAAPAVPARNILASAPAPRLGAAVPLPRPAPRSVLVQGAPNRAAAPYRLASLGDTALPAPAAYAPPDSEATKDANPLAGDLSHTAIYDISAHTVYLPGGQRLEAHSGLGDYMDDVRAVHLRKRGPTPPNVYDLTLRESLFHGVQAIRLNPVDGAKMYGRDGMLVHPFMLGPQGDSNGCVSLKDYPAFLKAYQRGEVTRMVVVEQLDDPPGGRTAGEWFSSTLKRLFGRT